MVVNLPLYILQQNWMHKVKVFPTYTDYENGTDSMFRNVGT